MQTSEIETSSSVKVISKLNIGCGSNKLEGYLNIDADPNLKPDITLDIIKEPLPFLNDSIDEVVMFHTFEHIEKRHHPIILYEINKVLKIGGSFMVSFPEFTKCVKNWETNHMGKQEFWEATIFGRGLSKWDRHVCIMHTNKFVYQLKQFGFGWIFAGEESPEEPYNTLIKCEKVFKPLTRDDVLKEEIFD